MTHWSRGFAISRHKTKPPIIWYLQYHSGYRNQAWPDSDLSWEAHVHKVTKPTKSSNLAGWWLTLRGCSPTRNLIQVVLLDHVTNWKYYISLPWPQNFVLWWHRMRSSHNFWSYMIFTSWGSVRSCEKLNI